MTIATLKVVTSIRCQRGCAYCYNDAFGQRQSPRFELQAERVLRTVDRALREARPDALEIIGGEPLEDEGRDLSLRVLQLATAGGAPRIQRVVSSAVPELDAWRSFAKWVDCVYLSIDPDVSAQNKKPLVPGQLRELCAWMTDCGIELRVGALLTGRESTEDLDRFVSMLATTGVAGVGFGYQWGLPVGAVPVEVMALLFSHLFKTSLQGCGIELGGDVLDAIGQYFRGQVRRDYCRCGVWDKLVDPSGELAAGTCVGYGQGQLSAVDVVRVKSLRAPELLSKAPCQQCAAWGVCQGGCLWEARRQTGSFLDRCVNHCDVLKGALRRLESELPAPLRTLN